MEINEALVRRLLAQQFPHYTVLTIHPVLHSGWDNKTFRLGEHMLVRMPRAQPYEAQVAKEHKWLPRLKASLPLPIPEPIAMGEPGEGYPWKWSIYRWLDGKPAAYTPVSNWCTFAARLAQFLIALQRINPQNGPLPGQHNFYRGGLLKIYDAETRDAIAALKEKIEVDTAIEIWEIALKTSWQRAPVWIHGDVSSGNLLVKRGLLSSVIDFGMLGVGDPACDLSIAWTLLRGKSREAFYDLLSCDADTWARGRAWALWKALVVASNRTKTNSVEAEQSWLVIEEVLADYKRTKL